MLTKIISDVQNGEDQADLDFTIEHSTLSMAQDTAVSQEMFYTTNNPKYL
jgi:hypothetical protein